MTTLRSASAGVPAWRKGPAISLSTVSTCDPPSAGRAALPNSVRRNGISRTKVKPSSTDEMTVAAIVAANNIEYGRSSDSSRAPPPPPPPPPPRPPKHHTPPPPPHKLQFPL